VALQRCTSTSVTNELHGGLSNLMCAKWLKVCDVQGLCCVRDVMLAQYWPVSASVSVTSRSSIDTVERIELLFA